MTIMFLKWTKLFLFELYIKCKKNYNQLPSRDGIQNCKGFENQSHIKMFVALNNIGSKTKANTEGV